MKPLRLKLKGLNSFIEEQTIDFEKLTAKGLFGIFGPTGSGKSTVLDGITLCLYGEVARKSTNYINTNGDLLQVSFEFQISNTQDKRYRVEREFKRNKMGNIHTKSARILDITNSGEKLLEERTRQVTSKCEEIIGLNVEDFTRTVVLPQGKFSEFLKLQGKDRRDMLERLFNLEKYGDGLSQKLALEIRKYRTWQSELMGELKSFEDISVNILKEKNKILENSQANLDKCKKEFSSIEDNYIKSEELWKQQKELEGYSEELKELKMRENEIHKGELKIRLGESANHVKPYMERYESLKNEIDCVEKILQEKQEQIEMIHIEREKMLEEFHKASQDKEVKLPHLNKKHMQFEDAVKIQESLVKLVVESNELQEILMSLELDIEKSRVEDRELQRMLNDINLEIQTKENELEYRKVSPEYKEKLRIALSLREKVQDKIKKKFIVERNIEELENTIANLQIRYNQLQEEFRIDVKAIDEVTLELENLLKSCPGDQRLLLQKSNELNISEQSWQAYREYSSSLKKKEIHYANIVQILNQKLIQKDTLVQVVENLDLRVKAQNKENIAQLLRESLKEGDPCPVCGSQDHQINIIPYRDLKDLNILNEQLELQNNRLNELVQEIAKLDANREIEETNIQHIKSDINRLGTDFLSIKEDVMKGEFLRLQESMNKYEKNKSELENILNRRKEDKSKREIAMSEVSSSLKGCRGQEQKYKEDLEQVSNEIHVDEENLNKYRIDLGITDLLDTHHEILKKDKESSELQKAIKELRERIDFMQKEKEILVLKEVRLSKSLGEYQVTLREKTKNIAEKQASMKEKVGGIVDVKGVLKEIIHEIEGVNNHYQEMELKKNTSDKEFNDVKDQINIYQNSLLSLQRQMIDAKINLDKNLKEQNFKTVHEVKVHILHIEDIRKLKEEVEEYNKKINYVAGAMNSIAKKIGKKTLSLEEWEEIQRNRIEKSSKLRELESSQIALNQEIKGMTNRLEKQKAILNEKEKVEEKLGLLNDLEKLFKGKRFVEYVAAHQLQYVVLEASKKLKEITGGSYGLEVDENGKFLIRDYKNGGAIRDASTLSGGETFLASLALALSLSAQIQLKGTAPLEFFFLDEGFGTLDDTTLEVVMDSLEGLHHEKLSIGIISHVESIKNRVPVKLMIHPAVSGLGGSKVKIEYS